MKILFVTSGTVKSNFTYRMVRLAKSMQKIGHDVAIMAPIADKYNNFIPETISEIEGVKVIQPFQFKTRRLEINLLPYILYALYLVFKNRTDLVYIYKPTPISVVGCTTHFWLWTDG
jgi:UDP:flavonoid glycosyltransferase YjiC (YdhE family)